MAVIVARLFGFSIALGGLIARPVLAQVFASSNGSFAGQIPAPPNLSASCAATFSQTVVCDPMLWQISKGNVLANSTDLELMCDPACPTSLQALRRSQVANCTASDTVTVSYKVYPATYMADMLLFTYNYACQQDSTGDYCLPLFQQYNSDNHSSPSDICSDCNLQLWQAVLESPFGYSDTLAANYSSITSSCGATGYPVTSPTAYAVGTTIISQSITTTKTGTAPTYTCESTYTIQESDSCVSVSLANQVSTFYLVNANKLPAFCTDFPAAGTDICIPQKCNTYVVAPWDTCDSVAAAKKLTTAQLMAYNPNLNSQCGNMKSLAGYVICLSPPGTVTTTRRARPTTTSIFANPCRNPGAPSSCYPPPTYTGTVPSLRPWPTRTVNRSDHTRVTTRTPATATTSLPAWTNPASLPRAPGTLQNCSRYDTYMDVPANSSLLECCNPNYCFAKAAFWGINGTQLMDRNPSLSYNVSDQSTWASCLFQEGFGYCVWL